MELCGSGHETIELDEDEAKKLIRDKRGTVHIVDAETKKILTNVRLDEDQALYIMEKIQGGSNIHRGSFFIRKDGKYFIYVPKTVAEDTSFPIKPGKVLVSFQVGKDKKELLIQQ